METQIVHILALYMKSWFCPKITEKLLILALSHKTNQQNVVFIHSDGVTVVLYNVMQTYNRMDVIEADQVLKTSVLYMEVFL